MRSRDRITTTAGLAALALAVHAIGGASRWIVVGVAVLAAIAAASQVNSRRRLAGLSPLLLPVGVAVGLTALQLVPLPDGVVATLQPTGHELIHDGEALSGETSAWRPLSMDPANTRVELAKLCAYLLLAWMALRAAASERGRQRLLAGVAGIAGLVALIGIVHELLGAERLYGIYEPVHARPIVLAPLLNANHLACLMALGALVAGGLAVHERRAPAVRAMWILVAIVCVAVVLWTKSRGGVIGLAAGSTVGAVILVLQRLRDAGDTNRRDVYRVAIPGAVIVLCTLVLVVFLGGRDVSQQLESTRVDEFSDPRSKYAAWRSAVQLVEEAPVLGVGRGAFEAAFTRVHPASSQVTFSHVENEYLQVVVDWGVLGAIAFGGALGLCAIAVARRWRAGALAAGAIGALTAVAAQSLVDFGLELPGIAIPTLIVAATLLHVPLKESSRSRKRSGLRAGAVIATLAVAAIAATPWSRTLAEDHDTLANDEVTAADVRDALARHPLDYLAAAYAARASTTMSQRIGYLNFALRLHPGHPGLHRTVARWLAATGRHGQAALEFRIAIAGTDTPAAIITEVLALYPKTADAVAALPPDYAGWNAIVTTLGAANRTDVAIAYLAKVVSTPGVQPTPELWRRVETLAENAGDLALAERAATELAQLEKSVPAVIRLARIQMLRKEYDRAVATLQPIASEIVTTREHIDARFMLCEVHVTRPDWQAARTCLTDILMQPAVSLEIRRKVHSRLAKVEEALGNPERAEFERKLASPGGQGVDGSGGLR